MEKKAWPAFKSCMRNKRIRSDGGELKNDRLSELPDDVLLSILSSLTTKEAARTSLISHKYNKLWRSFPVLTFEDSRASKRIEGQKYSELVGQERSNFVSWVNNIVGQYLGPAIDEFRVTFDLNNDCQSHIDKWVVFALAKQVKKLDLDFEPFAIVDIRFQEKLYSLPLECCIPLTTPVHKLGSNKLALTSLCLRYVNITTEVVECLLHCCPLLENLSIYFSDHLTSIISASSLPLKNLEVCRCDNLETIDISVPKLLSFKYAGQPIKLHLGNASLLVEASVNSAGLGYLTDYAVDSLSEYFSKLEYLQLGMCLCGSVNLGINQSPALLNLKYLELIVNAECHQSLLGWAPLIEASPMLQKLKLELLSYDSGAQRAIVKREGRPLKCLKTLDLHGFKGLPVDLEFATYVVENAIMLEEVIVTIPPSTEGADIRVRELEGKLPQGAKLLSKIYSI